SSTGSYKVPTHTAYQYGDGCQAIDSRGTHYSDYLWRVTNPASPGVCYPDNSYDLPDKPTQVVVTGHFGVGYQLITPSPLSMASGIYRGSTEFTVGETAG